ncbi:DUF6850 family outer membrane beta-barrel protein [Sphingobacterium haloxyli]|uniref:DUF6850 domain-containing protein n=1 Tax=Sphingobacterium haloxyli TaxID=2100533 RepID=A0A2S9IYF1_9SPHI|nr:DUF6850 family outer membrane beta-barrel protein [Sphingobacterium haloxyli]PRD45553.1 hypothetical protein C5745_17740 [Sphingobacterium haloxyli]
MSIYQNITFYLLALLSLGYANSVVAQQETVDNMLQWEVGQQYGNWRHTGNAAGLLVDRPAHFSVLQAGYSSQAGDFRRPQEARKSTQADVGTLGNIYLGDLYIQGHFGYARQDRRDAEYNASLIDPFRGMPYMIADTNASHWANEHYHLGFELAFPLKDDRLQLGLAMEYRSSSGAKQRDVRALNRFYALEVSPGVLYRIAPKYRIGVHVSYRNHKEEATNRSVNNEIDQGYFSLYGLGHSIARLGYENLTTTRQTNYEADRIGVGLQYGFEGPWSVLLSGNYEVGAENVHVGFMDTRPEGTLLQDDWTVTLALRRSQEHWKHIIDAKGYWSNARGSEYINEFVPGLDSDGYMNRYSSVRSTYDKSSIGASYELIKMNGSQYSYRAKGRLAYGKTKDRYLIPSSTFAFEEMLYGASFEKAFSLSSATTSLFSIGVSVDYRQCLNANYDYGGALPNSLPVADMMAQETHYFASDFLTIGVPLVYSFELSTARETSLFIKAHGFYQRADQTFFDHRKGVQVSVGATF